MKFEVKEIDQHNPGPEDRDGDSSNGNNSNDVIKPCISIYGSLHPQRYTYHHCQEQADNRQFQGSRDTLFHILNHRLSSSISVTQITLQQIIQVNSVLYVKWSI